MKKVLLILLMFSLTIMAEKPSNILAGMRNGRYAFVGLQTKYDIGFAVESSVHVQKPEIQYGRGILFYTAELPYEISLDYALYAGMRYDQEFYDFGSRFSVLYKLHSRYLHLNGVLQPFYDSDYDGHVGYLVGARTFFLPEVALFASFKNLPEIRAVERRVSGGLLFETQHLSVMPELSMPINGEIQLTRVSISFLYKLPI